MVILEVCLPWRHEEIHLDPVVYLQVDGVLFLQEAFLNVKGQIKWMACEMSMKALLRLRMSL